MSNDWNPEQYNKFKEQRAKPFWDLLSLIRPGPISRVLDLGCGTGELTQELHKKLGAKETLGIDSSEAMLEQSKAFTQPGLSFRKEDIMIYSPEKLFDLVFSNAALQWVPDNETNFPRILSWIAPGGQLAVQVPCNFDHPSHKVAEKTFFHSFPFKKKNYKAPTVLDVARYAELMHSYGFKNPIARVEVYGHAMNSGRDVIEWTKGTLLTHYKTLLNAEEFDMFLYSYSRSLIAQIGTGPYYYAFKRILLWGQRE